MATIWAEILRRDRVGALDDFFALGGHSLLATRLVHAINQRMSAQLSLRDLFRNPVLADLAAELDRADTDAAAAYRFDQLVPDPAGRHQPFPLTDIQQAYWVGRDSTIELGGVGAHGYSELRMPDFDLPRFSQALNRLIVRHDMLRAVFDADGSQRVLPEVPEYRMPCQDLRGLPAEVAEQRLAELRQQLSHRVFDAGRWPLFEFAVTWLDDEVRLHVGIDGLIVDVASSQILERELTLRYLDPAVELPALSLTFRDYVLAERELRDTPRYQRALRYWRDRVAELAPAPGLPLARPPESVARPEFTRYQQVLPAEAWSALRTAATQRGVTPSVLLLTAFAEVLGRWSRQPAFTLSLPLFNRLPLHPDINAIIGDFTSLVLLEVDTAGPASFAERARAVQERLWQDIDHAAVSGVRVNRELAQARGTAQAALPIVFNSTLSELVTAEDDGGLATALRAEPVHSITQTPQVWIDHTVLEAAGRLHYNWDSIDELFPAGLVGAMFAEYHGLLTELTDPAAWSRPAGELLPGARLATAVDQPDPDQPLLHELFDRQAARTPDAPAVLAPDRQLSYRQLRTEARQLAGRLQQRGVRPGELVAVLADRGWQQPVATLAVLYAGAGYVPIDPSWPAERVGHVLERIDARLALVGSARQTRPRCATARSACASRSASPLVAIVDRRGRRERPHPGGQPGDASGTDHGPRGDGARIFRPPSRADRVGRGAEAAAVADADRRDLPPVRRRPRGRRPLLRGRSALSRGPPRSRARGGPGAVRDLDRQDAGVPRPRIPRRRACCSACSRWCSCSSARASPDGTACVYGVLSYDVAHLLGGAVLVLSFGLLYQRRIKAVVNTYARAGASCSRPRRRGRAGCRARRTSTSPR